MAVFCHENMIHTANCYVDVTRQGRMVLLVHTACKAAYDIAHKYFWFPITAPEENYVNFVDSRGLFSCRIPAGFLRAERTSDKRGTLFVAGDYNKAEVMSVQAVTAYDLLTDAGEDVRTHVKGTRFSVSAV